MEKFAGGTGGSAGMKCAEVVVMERAERVRSSGRT